MRRKNVAVAIKHLMYFRVKRVGNLLCIDFPIILSWQSKLLAVAAAYLTNIQVVHFRDQIIVSDKCFQNRVFPNRANNKIWKQVRHEIPLTRPTQTEIVHCCVLSVRASVYRDLTTIEWADWSWIHCSWNGWKTKVGPLVNASAKVHSPPYTMHFSVIPVNATIAYIAWHAKSSTNATHH